jgi:hypothetical protein
MLSFRLWQQATALDRIASSFLSIKCNTLGIEQNYIRSYAETVSLRGIWVEFEGKLDEANVSSTESSVSLVLEQIGFAELRLTSSN